MQKKIIALAVAAAFSAPAFADTTVYGVVDAAVARLSATGERSDLVAVSGGLSSSRLGFKSVEDLNNGMKAVVVLEYGLDTQTSNNAAVGSTSTSSTTCAGTACPSATFATYNTTTTTTSGSATNIAARQQMLAIAGDFGTFATGYLQTTGYDWAGKFDPTSGSAVSPLQSMTKGTNVIGSTTAGARAQRALAYISPDMGGVTVALNYSTAMAGLGNLTLASAAPETKVTALLASATYSAGPLTVGGVYAKTSNPSASAKEDMKEFALGGSYDLGVAKMFMTYQTNKADSVAALGVLNYKSNVMSLSVVAPVGPGAVAFSYAKNKTTANAALVPVSTGGNGYVLAWLQGLSKTTTLYAAVEKVKNNTGETMFSAYNNAVANGSMTAGGSSTLIALGLNKKF